MIFFEPHENRQNQLGSFSRNFGLVTDRDVKGEINAISYNRNKDYLPYFCQDLKLKKKVVGILAQVGTSRGQETLIPISKSCSSGLGSVSTAPYSTTNTPTRYAN